MSINWIALVEGGIPVLAGLYATALGYGWIRGRPQSDDASRKWIRHFRWLGPLLVIVGSFLGWQAYEHGARPSAQQLAAQISAKLSLPAQVDEATRIDSVSGAADTITYRYTVTVPIDPANLETFEAQLREQIGKQACTDPGFAEILRAGYAVEMRYTLTGSDRAISVVTPPTACAAGAPAS